jgi:hypothetical protein
LGALTDLKTDWSGDMSEHPLSHDIAKILDDAAERFKPGSYVAVPRKEKSKKELWIAIEAIADANLVDITKLSYPVVMARLTRLRGKDDARDNRYNVGGDDDHFLIVTPMGGMKARWDIVAVKDPFLKKKQARVVSAGDTYHHCENGKGPKDAPFAWFLSCDAQMLDFETIMLIKGLRSAGSARADTVLQNQSPEVRRWAKMAIENDELIWITCGLGCCST